MQPPTLFRRHTRACPFHGTTSVKCKCPIHVKPQRVSLKTNNWNEATRKLREMEDSLGELHLPVARTVTKAIEAYIADCTDRQRAESTLRGYHNTLGALREFCDRRKLTDLGRVTVDDLREFKHERSQRLKPQSQRQDIVNLRAFSAFCVEQEWLPQNLAKKLRLPKIEQRQTLPYSREESRRLIAACDELDAGPKAERSRLRAKAMVLVMLHTGLRISDTLLLRRDQFDKEGRTTVTMMKTQKPLYVRMKPIAMAALKAVPVQASGYFFWSGKGSIDTATRIARRTIASLGKIAGVENARPHRFRDTFATEMLGLGADIRGVQLMLGHDSIRTTEKFYAPFVKSTQDGVDRLLAQLEYSEEPKLEAPLLEPRMNTLSDGLRDTHGDLRTTPGVGISNTKNTGLTGKYLV